MPSRKQRRRREKDRRHEYEYVYVDDEGQEVDATEAPEPDRPRPQKATASPRPARSTGGRPVRKVAPPSWRKTLRRGAIFAPVMFLVIKLLSKNLSTAQILYQTVVLIALFIPFSYLMDRMMYRTYLRKTGQEPPRPQPRRENGRKP
jgi:hypothetical protein